MADSIAIKVIIVGTVAFSLFWSIVSWVLNMFLGGYSNLLQLSILSLDTVQHLNTVVDLWILSPAIFLLGLALWTIERAKGTNIPPELFYMYETVLMVSILYSFMMIGMFGAYIDVLYNCFFTQALLSLLLPEVNMSVTSLFMLGIQIVYAYCMMPAYIGVALYILHPSILQGDSLIFGKDDAQTGSYTTNWEQF